MEPKIIWLFVFVVLYSAFCIFWGIKRALGARTASDYIIAGRRLSPWAFILATTAVSFSGWIFMAQPGMIHADGLPLAYLSFCAIVVPFTGLLFLKRQWIIGKRFGFVTPGEMLSYYFLSDAIRLLVVVVALVFSVPYLAVQLRAAGFLLHVLTDGLLSVDAGMWGLAAVLFLYVAAGGLRAVAEVAVLQCILLAAGIVIIGGLVLHEAGAWTALAQDMGLAGTGTDPAPDGSSQHVALPGGTFAPGGGVMLLTAMLALMGIQAAPAFSMWAFASRDPAPFAPQQVWASALVLGIILLLLAAMLGAIGGPSEQGGRQALPAQLIDLMSATWPWLMGLLAICALAAMQAAGAAYTSTAGGIIARDLVGHFLIPNARYGIQALFGRIGAGVIVLLALVLATTSTDTLVRLGGLGVAYGVQMFPALIAACYWPWLKRQGIVLGLIAGLVAVTLTDMPAAVGIEAWGRWPWTIHAAGWGIIFNLAVALLVSAISRDDIDRKMEFHNLLAQHASLPPDRRKLIPAAWIIALAWFFFAVGPGALIGEWLLGDPDEPATWLLDLPPLWAWQLLWWALGVAMMWFLAYVMQMATAPETEVEALAEDIGEIERAHT
jgi:solute:Na+ symporter, SSS family